MKYSKNQMGFTLIELMITVAIVGIIAAIAAPSFQRQIANMKLKDAIDLTEMVLKQARVDAMVYQSPVTVVVHNTRRTITAAQAINGGSGAGCTDAAIPTISNRCRVVSHTYDGKVNISYEKGNGLAVGANTDNAIPYAFAFSPQKSIVKKVSQFDFPDTSGTQKPGFGFCYTGISGEKKVVTVDKNTNINVITQGTC